MSETLLERLNRKHLFFEAGLYEREIADLQAQLAAANERAKKAEKYIRDRFVDECAWCGKQFAASEYAKAQEHTQRCESNPLVKELDAANARNATALRMVHHCLLALPNGEFKERVARWLESHLDQAPAADPHVALTLSDEFEERYKNHWRDKDEFYWMSRLREEIDELYDALHGVHKDTPEWELSQIRAIAGNWLKMRYEKEYKV